MSNALFPSPDSFRRRGSKAYLTRRAADISHSAYIFQGHGLDLVAFTMRHEVDEQSGGTVMVPKSGITHCEAHRRDFHLRGHAPHPP